VLFNNFKLQSWPHTHKTNPVYFTHVALRKFNGNPTISTSNTCYKQVKANGASVLSTLGGGRHGHGRLDLTTNATPYTRIAYILQYQHLSDPTIRERQCKPPKFRRTHNLAVASYHQINFIEKIILYQMQEALDDSVPMPLVNDDTGTIKSSIPEVYSTFTATSLTRLSTKSDPSYCNINTSINSQSQIFSVRYANMRYERKPMAHRKPTRNLSA